MPKDLIAVQIFNSIKKTDETSKHDRVLVNVESVPWNPQTFYPGDKTTDQLNFGFVPDLSNPAKGNANPAYNLYFWLNDGSNLTATSTPQYGMSIAVDTLLNFQLVSSTPGTIVAATGASPRFLTSSGIVYPPDSIYNSYYINFYILNTIPVIVENNTGEDLPYFMNTLLFQPNPVSLTDFTMANSNGVIPRGGKLKTSIYNITCNDITNTDNIYCNCGLYFFAKDAAVTDTAVAATSIDMNGGGVQNLSGDVKIANNGYTFSVGDKPPTSPGTNGLTKAAIWLWVGVAIGIIILLILFALVIHYVIKMGKKNKEAPEKSHSYDDYNDFKDDPALAKHHAAGAEKKSVS